MKKITYSILLFLILASTNSCVEEFNAATVEFEDAIIIEATITNEFKHQKILLSRTHKFEEDGPSAETSATVLIISNSNTTYTFSETEPGVYTSDIQFSALPSSNYQLSVATSNGREYLSEFVGLTSSSSTIENIYAIRETNEDGVDGIAIYVDSFDPTSSSKYYGYEYEETYQIVAPFWMPDEFLIVPATDTSPINLTITPRTQEERECYTTLSSFGKELTDTNLLSEDRVEKFLVKFFPVDDIRINSRYSILIKQYTQSVESYNYLEILNNLSGSESLFSQNQPGFLAGNITSTNNPNEKVLGYFEASSVTEERFFVDRSEIFDSSDFFDWPICEITSLPVSELLRLVRTDKVSFYEEVPPVPTEPLSFRVVPSSCGDCTKLGSNIKPNFWID
tara:strand:+ start:15745 stop:16929 length:1185 start_codon:yes stop_codon:yes gene_type:complete